MVEGIAANADPAITMSVTIEATMLFISTVLSFDDKNDRPGAPVPSGAVRCTSEGSISHARAKHACSPRIWRPKRMGELPRGAAGILPAPRGKPTRPPLPPPALGG